MNSIDLFTLTYCFTQLAQTMQENQTGGLITVALLLCIAVIWKPSGGRGAE